MKFVDLADITITITITLTYCGLRPVYHSVLNVLNRGRDCKLREGSLPALVSSSLQCRCKNRIKESTYSMRQMSAGPHSRRQRLPTAEAVLSVTAKLRLVAKSGRRNAKSIKERAKIRDCLWPLLARTAHELDISDSEVRGYDIKYFSILLLLSVMERLSSRGAMSVSDDCCY